MAFNKLNDFTDQLKAEYLSLKRKSEQATQARKWVSSDVYDGRAWAVLEVMCMYYNTVLATAKFKGQKEYLKQVMYEINPPFAQGFFKPRKPGTGN